jgi:hypothetical protein
MPMHDWTRVKAGTYHNFHLRWIASNMDRLNAGLLPAGYFAMAEQFIGGPNTDVIALQTESKLVPPDRPHGGVATARIRPKTRFVMPIPTEAERYAQKANRIAIHHDLGEVVAVIEIISPGNKDRKHSVGVIVEKAIERLQQQVSLLLIDPFPPGRNDPQGLHGALSAELVDEPFTLPPDKPLTFASYQVGPSRTAYVEPIAVGDALPDMPLFLYEDQYINVPLEETYQATWNVLPDVIKRLLERDG